MNYPLKLLLVNMRQKNYLKSMYYLYFSYIKSNYVIVENPEELEKFISFLNSINRLNYLEKKRIIEYKPINEIDFSLVSSNFDSRL